MTDYHTVKALSTFGVLRHQKCLVSFCIDCVVSCRCKSSGYSACLVIERLNTSSNLAKCSWF